MVGWPDGQGSSEDILRCMIDTDDEIPRGEYIHIDLAEIIDEIDESTLIVLKGVPFARDHYFFLPKTVDRSVIEDFTGEGTRIGEDHLGFDIRGDFREWAIKSVVPEKVDRYILLQTTSRDRFEEARELLHKL